MSEDKNRKKAGEKALKRISGKRKQALGKFDMEALRLLSPMQRDAVNGHTLWKSIRKYFNEFGFDEEQNEKSVAICGQIAKGYLGRRSIGSDRTKQKAAMIKVAKEVFTKDQKKAYKRQENKRRKALAEKRKKEREKKKKEEKKKKKKK